MPDEVGTEATRSDVPSADESLFGDPADDRAAPVVQEEDSNDAVPDEPEGGGETAQDEQGSGEADEQAAGEETEALEDLKVVVSIKGGRATIGVQQPSSDPHIETFDGPGRIRADAGGLGGGRKGEGQVGGRRPSIPAHVETRSTRPGAGTGAGRGRRRRSQPKRRRRRRRSSRR